MSMCNFSIFDSKTTLRLVRTTRNDSSLSYIHLVYDTKIPRSYSLFVHSLVLFHARAVRLPREFRIGVVHFLRHVSPLSLSLSLVFAFKFSFRLFGRLK